MAELHTEITIQAPVERIWSILMDFESYPEWNPFISRITGRAEPGERLEVRLTPPDGMAMSMKPEVVSVEDAPFVSKASNRPEVMEASREFSWLGHLGVNGVFDGRHIFLLFEEAQSTTRFVQREEFSGLLAAPILLLVRKSTLRGFEAMNQALKQRAEA